jgi:hypothetical protein
MTVPLPVNEEPTLSPFSVSTSHAPDSQVDIATTLPAKGGS